MKKIGKVLLAISILSITATKSFATSSVQKSSGIGDAIPFIIGGILVVVVLALGYKMDNSSENAPTIKKSPKVKNKKENIEKQETEIYAQENKSDIPYEEDFDITYEKDEDIGETSLYEDTEYEEDDISLFSDENSQESSFEDIDDSISYEVDNIEENEEDLNLENVVQEEKLEEVENLNKNDDFEYTEPVEGLDEKIDSLDDLEDYSEENLIKKNDLNEEQEAEEFLNELNKYKEEAEAEETEFSGFTTNVEAEVTGVDIPDESVEEPSIQEEISQPEEIQEEKHIKRYTKKKASKGNIEDDEYVELPSDQTDFGFLDQMEENLKKNQEERLKATEKTPKKRGRKPKKQED